MAPISSGKQFYHKQGDVGCKGSGKRDRGGVPTYSPGYIRFVQGAYDPDSASLLRDPDVVLHLDRRAIFRRLKPGGLRSRDDLSSNISKHLFSYQHYTF